MTDESAVANIFVNLTAGTIVGAIWSIAAAGALGIDNSALSLPAA